MKLIPKPLLKRSSKIYQSRYNSLKPKLSTTDVDEGDLLRNMRPTLDQMQADMT